MLSLSDGPVGPHLVRLTVPMFLGISSMIVASMIDTIYVGWIGTRELAAVSFTFPVVMALMSLSMGIGIGASSIIARRAGSGDTGGVRQLTTHTLVLVALVVVALAAAGERWGATTFAALGADAELLPLVLDYMTVWFVGFPLFAVPMVAGSIFRSVGNARITGIVMTSGAIIQVVIAPLLIFGVGSWDGLGFVGSAWAFALSRGVSFCIAVYALVVHMRLWTLAGFTVAAVLRSWREVLAIGVPATLSNLIGPATLAIIVSLLASHGHAVVAAFGVASRIESLATMVLMAMSSSIGPFVGQNFGAGRLDRIRRAMRLGYRFSHLWGIGMFAVLALGGPYFVPLINADPEVIDATCRYLLLVSCSYGFLGTSMVSGSTFIALGQPLPTLAMSIGRMLVIYVPLAMVADRLFGYAGIFAATSVANVLMGLVAAAWVARNLGRVRAAAAPAAAT